MAQEASRPAKSAQQELVGRESTSAMKHIAVTYRGEGSSGSRGAPTPLDPKTPWSPPSFWRRNDEEEGEEEERKEEISPPPLRISGFTTGHICDP